ncbi:MAG: helix-turn-helix domain-containing protein [Prevotella sp.]|nr:helix-turn-helix domain-containing protein [Alistipes senegalensis]MCM1358225.1 helix-turn-helix domain-containing protein [Prevotella sp.]MDE6427126.1 helix-turn-helix domain-containing protein [Ruminococcus sp.]
MKFGQKIKIRREELGYTQAELAQKVHTTQPYVSRLERGHFNPSMNMIVKISTALLISVDYLLLDETGYPERSVN